MSDEFICVKTGEACPMANLCEVANGPLNGAVREVAEACTGRARRPAYAGAVLRTELAHTGHTLAADFFVQVDDTDAAICPREVLSRPAPRGLTVEQVAAGIGLMASNCVQNTIRDLQTAEQQRQHRQS